MANLPVQPPIDLPPPVPGIDNAEDHRNTQPLDTVPGPDGDPGDQDIDAAGTEADPLVRKQ